MTVITARAAPLVLVADDDSGARLLISSALRGSGIDVVTAENGEEALDKARHIRPDCVVLDVVMPGMSGLDVCRQLRRDQHSGHLPVLIMTSLDDFAAINDAYSAGATDFSPKGISPRLIVERVRFMLRAKRDSDALRSSEARLESAQRLARLGHAQWAADGTPICISSMLLSILRLPAGTDLSYELLLERIHPDDRAAVDSGLAQTRQHGAPFSIEHRLICADGPERIAVLEGCVLNDGPEAGAFMVTLQDVTEYRRAESRARYLTYIDELTGMPNRALLRETIDNLLALEPRSFAVFVIDLDNFNRFNETLGQAGGDQLLRSAAARIQRAIRDTDMCSRQALAPEEAGTQRVVGRIGGDEFVIVAPGVADTEQARSIAERVQNALEEAFEVGEHALHLTATIGISLAPTDGTDTESLLTRASAAAVHGKSTEDRDIQFYVPEFNARARRRMSLEDALRKAVDRAEFELHYQPRIAPASGTIAGAEALIRWNHPQLGRINPDEFISLAEQLGLIEPIGEWVLGEAAAQLARWRSTHLPCGFVSVNLSPVQMRNDRAMLRQILDAIERNGLEPHCLEVEITEGVLIRQPQSAVRLCQSLRSTGIGIALDDFGTGYSALGYLRRFPVTAIKIDRSFVSDVNTAIDSQAIVHSILALAQGLRLTTVAEGVETVEQSELLFSAGCEQLQGYLFSKPLPAAAFATWCGGWQGFTPSGAEKDGGLQSAVAS